MARLFALLVAVVVVATGSSCSGTDAAQSAPPDVIYYNGKFVTVDDKFSYAQAVAITADKFTAVGTNETVRRLAGASTRQIDLRELTVVPGLADNHLHSAGGGPGVDLSRTRSISEVLQAVAARVTQSTPGD